MNSYCSSVINDGYSREYILENVNEIFFNKDINRIGKNTIQKFFSIFDNKERKYIVYLPVMPAVAVYLSKVFRDDKDIIKQLHDLPEDARAALSAHNDHDAAHQFLVLLMDALDPFVAMRKVDQLISAATAMTYLGRRGIALEWHRHGYVKLPRAKKGQIASDDKISFQKQSTQMTKRFIKELTSPAQKILGNLTTASKARMFNAVNMAALARISDRPESQLISLWSSIEVLLSDPPRGVARVTHYVDALTPCICIKYVRQYIIALYDELQIHYRKHLEMFFKENGFSSSIDQYTNFTRLLFLDENKHLHQKFCLPMQNNPLALYRLWKIEKNFGNPKNYLQSVIAHEQRVSWQLHRIYRTRNSIVHSGKIPSFLTPLSLNLFEYFRSATGSIIGRSDNYGGKAEIDQVVAEIGFDFQKIKSNLEKRDKKSIFTVEDLSRFHR